MSEEKRGQEVAPGMNPEERPDLQDYKSKDKATGKKTDFTSVTTSSDTRRRCASRNRTRNSFRR